MIAVSLLSKASSASIHDMFHNLNFTRISFHESLGPYLIYLFSPGIQPNSSLGVNECGGPLFIASAGFLPDTIITGLPWLR
jgi:hypothetical protein